MKTAFLVLCHRLPVGIMVLAKRYPECQFYVHYDAKSPLAAIQPLTKLPNVQILRQRINVRWAGFSMIEATLALIQTALAQSDNQYFHLISGNCLLLTTPQNMATEMFRAGEGALLMESRPTLRLRYRVRFNTPHADTAWQRQLHGKILTKLFQAADWLAPFADTAYTGSQWFSADRKALNILFQAALSSDAADFFEKKLCPDEHFFQYIVQNLPAGCLKHINHNRRYIAFKGNHPNWLTVTQLPELTKQYWFARKADDDFLLKYQ
ncbi:MAG: beta-1,6-N-acetylglucosaminyltransferase [Alysiella sp.]|uniref:beta-1,6-N-acetylglucosaminyltransferase n=1 Tax=Alysiella sp. TaxID=1872483 RepID=UPI0026DD3047|nr:beta-1,6-N-acetylglucosaminyltransferase [Alysiella sp.]MDO4433504.1 beta-1,6-N-acetylglucosaminyltransferase [Alysiella sp.]